MRLVIQRSREASVAIDGEFVNDGPVTIIIDSRLRE